MAYVAYEGGLVDVVHMRKDIITKEGRAWGGELALLAYRLEEHKGGCERPLWTSGMEEAGEEDGELGRS